MNLFKRLYDYAVTPTVVKNQLNKYRPRTNVNRGLLRKFKKGVNRLDDNLDDGVLSNVDHFDPKNPIATSNRTTIYDAFVDEAQKPFNPENNPRDVIQRFEGKGLERVNIPDNEQINARLNQDAFRAEILGGSDLAKRVVYWSGNNALHNRYDNLPRSEKLALAKLMHQYEIKAPHRSAIAPNASNTKKRNNKIAYDIDEGHNEADKALVKDWLENGIIDAGIATPWARDRGSKKNWLGLQADSGHRAIPSVYTRDGGYNTGAYSDFIDAADKYIKQGNNFLSESDWYPINRIDRSVIDHDKPVTYDKPYKRFRGSWVSPAAFLHEVNHSENINRTGAKYLNEDIPKKIGFWNPHAYAGSHPAETTRAIQSSRIPVTKMLMDKVERLAPDIIPNYNKMSPKDQLDLKAQIIAQLAEDPDIAQTSWKRWGLWNPNLATKKPKSTGWSHLTTIKGLDYRIPKKYLTGESSIDPEIIDSIIGLDRSTMYSTFNPKWKKFLKMYYPQQIAGITAAATPAVYSALQNNNNDQTFYN